MSDIEPGQQTVSSKNTSKGGNGVSKAAPISEVPAGAATVQLQFDSVLGLLRKLRDERDPGKRLEAETCALAQLWSMRNVMVESLLPVLREWLRNPRNTGAEGLFLSCLSGARLHAPGEWDQMLALAGSIDLPETTRGLRLFVDLSVTGKAILSLFDMRVYRHVIEDLGAVSSTVDVGRLVRRHQSAIDNGALTQERWTSYDTCRSNWIIAGTGIGAMLGAGLGPGGAAAGAFGGAGTGASLGDYFCSGLKELAVLPRDVDPIPGPFNPNPPFPENGRIAAPPDIGVPGIWCWPPFETPPFVPPHWPSPWPMPWPRPPLLPWPLSSERESASVGDVASVVGLDVELLGPNALLVHR